MENRIFRFCHVSSLNQSKQKAVWFWIACMCPYIFATTILCTVQLSNSESVTLHDSRGCKLVIYMREGSRLSQLEVSSFHILFGAFNFTLCKGELYFYFYKISTLIVEKVWPYSSTYVHSLGGESFYYINKQKLICGKWTSISIW